MERKKRRPKKREKIKKIKNLVVELLWNFTWISKTAVDAPEEANLPVEFDFYRNKDLMILDVMYKWLLLHYGSVKEPKLQSESIKIEIQNFKFKAPGSA